MEEKPLEQQILEAFFRVLRIQRHRIHPAELSPAETFVISHIHHLGPGVGMRVSDIASRMMITTSAMTQILKGLEARGLVIKNRSEADRRVVMVHTTSKGDALMEKSMERMRAAFLRLTDELGRVDSETLLGLLRRAVDFFERDTRDELPGEQTGQE